MASSLTSTPNLSKKPEGIFFLLVKLPCIIFLNGSPLPSEYSLNSPNKTNQVPRILSPVKLHPHLSLLSSQDTYSSFRIQLRCRFLQEVFFACPSDVSQVVLLSTPRTLFLNVIITLRTVHFYCPLTYLSPPGVRGYATVVHICQMSWATQLPVHRRKPRLEATTG